MAGPLFGALPAPLADAVRAISDKIHSMLAAGRPDYEAELAAFAKRSGGGHGRSAGRVAAQLNVVRANVLETINSHEVKQPEIAPVSPVVSVLLAKLCVFLPVYSAPPAPLPLAPRAPFQRLLAHVECVHAFASAA